MLCWSLQSASAQAIPYERLLAIVQSQDIGSAEFPSVQWRKSTAEALHSYCKSALSRVPRDPPRVGLTEEGASDIVDMIFEFAHWRLATIFLDCNELTQELLDTRDVHHEIHSWIKLARLLEHDKTVLSLIVNTGMLPPRNDGSYDDNIFGTASWWTVREFIFYAVLNLLRSCAMAAVPSPGSTRSCTM